MVNEDAVKFGFTGVALLNRDTLSAKVKIAYATTNSFAFFVAGTNDRFRADLELPEHTMQPCLIPAMHVKDTNALLQGFLFSFGPRAILPMTRKTDVCLRPITTIEHFVWVESDHSEFDTLKQSPHLAWSKLLTQYTGFDIFPHDISNPRTFLNRTSVTVRTLQINSAKFKSLSGANSIFSNYKNKEDHPDEIAVVWSKVPLVEFLDKAQNLEGFRGIIPSNQNSSFGARSLHTNLAAARAALSDDPSKYYPDIRHVHHKYTFESKGWPITTDPTAVIDTLKDWNWHVIFLRKHDYGTRSTFFLGSQDPPPHNLVYLDTGAFIINLVPSTPTKNIITILPSARSLPLPVVPSFFLSPSSSSSIPSAIEAIVHTHTLNAVQNAQNALGTEYAVFSNTIEQKLTSVFALLNSKFSEIERLRLDDIQRLEQQRANDLKVFREENAIIRTDQNLLSTSFAA